MPHSAALLGRGSEVLGFDDEMSGDHNWEPRAQLFVRKDGDQARRRRRGAAPECADAVRGRPLVGVHTIRGYFRASNWTSIWSSEITVRDWFTFPEQKLRMFTAGAVFHDEVGLQAVRDRLAYYPRDVWLYLMIAAWWRVHPEMNLVGRAGYRRRRARVGADRCAARAGPDAAVFPDGAGVRAVPKWFGTAFSRLSCGPSVVSDPARGAASRDWQEREEALMAAYRAVAESHNRLEITPPVELGMEQMCGRPFKVVWGDFPGALAAEIKDPEVRRVVRALAGRRDRRRSAMSLWKAPGPAEGGRLLRLGVAVQAGEQGDGGLGGRVWVLAVPDQVDVDRRARRGAGGRRRRRGGTASSWPAGSRRRSGRRRSRPASRRRRGCTRSSAVRPRARGRPWCFRSGGRSTGCGRGAGRG